MARAPDPGTDAGFLAEVRRRSRPVDGLVLLAAPAVLLGVYGLPVATRSELVFDRATPSLLTAFSAHFVHLEAAHLLGNLAVYALIAPTVYLLLLLGGRRSEFLAVSVTVLVAFPFVLTGLDSLVLRRGTLVGFSGLAMAFVGVLPVATFLFLDNRTAPPVGLDDSPVLFFAGMALVAVRVATTRHGLAIAAGAAALSVGYAVRLARAVPSWRTIRRLVHRSGYVELALASPVLFGLALVAAFPMDPAGEGTVVDLFGHFLGYSLGFLATYLTVRLSRAVGGDVDPSERPPSTADADESPNAPASGDDTPADR